MKEKGLLIKEKKEGGFLEHLDIPQKTIDKVVALDKEAIQEVALEYGLEMDNLLDEAKKEAARRFPNYAGGYQMNRKPYAEGSLLVDDMAMMEEEMPTHTMPDGTIMPGATHKEGEMIMEQEESENMLPDDDMEADYLDFILDEALTDEEEDMLMSKLEQDEQMAMLFDKVIDVAQEFAGSGPVKGPGSGVSDSIPARLSDGEFVFTAKAVEEIGADNLMAMMKDAEMKADERQGLAEGGIPEEEETVVMPVEQPAAQQDIRVTKTTVGTEASQQEVNDLVDEEVKKSMLRGSRNLG